jgi:hypothetical protein
LVGGCGTEGDEVFLLCGGHGACVGVIDGHDYSIVSLLGEAKKSVVVSNESRSIHAVSATRGSERAVA